MCVCVCAVHNRPGCLCAQVSNLAPESLFAILSPRELVWSDEMDICQNHLGLSIWIDGGPFLPHERDEWNIWFKRHMCVKAKYAPTPHPPPPTPHPLGSALSMTEDTGSPQVRLMVTQGRGEAGRLGGDWQFGIHRAVPCLLLPSSALCAVRSQCGFGMCVVWCGGAFVYVGGSQSVWWVWEACFAAWVWAALHVWGSPVAWSVAGRSLRPLFFFLKEHWFGVRVRVRVTELVEPHLVL